MNLLFITVDGGRVDRILKSNVFNELMKKGTAFSKVICYAPYTIAAMHAVFSGEYGFNTGVNSYWSSFRFKNDIYKTITQYLHDAGYLTFGDSINKLILPKVGFDELLYHNEDKDDLLVRHKDLLDKVKKLSDDGKKFFLYLHYSNIHTNIKHNVLTKFDNFNIEYFKSRIINERSYDTYFKTAETYLKDILDYCDKLNLIENTLITIISDHGISVGEKFGERAYGVFCYDYTVTSFALFINEKIFPKKIITQQVRSIDIMPTILESLGISLDQNYRKISGQSLFPIIKGENEERSAIIESGNPLNSNKPPEEPNVVAIRNEKWKLIVNLHNNSMELYDLVEDPTEENNIYYNKPQIAEKLFEELKRSRKIE